MTFGSCTLATVRVMLYYADSDISACDQNRIGQRPGILEHPQRDDEQVGRNDGPWGIRGKHKRHKMSSSMSTIRVSSFDGPDSQPVIHSVPRPRLGDRAALIRIEACGVCGTDLHILRGHWPKRLPWPLTLGHELAGVIDV